MSVLPVPLLDEDNPIFPHPSAALKQPNGLLAVGGNLKVETLIKAYQQGIFPWFGEEDPILWWSPDPRMVLYPQELKISHSLQKKLKQKNFSYAVDKNFKAVIENCRQIERPHQEGTWITQEMIDAYCDLHAAGYAHSVEVYQADTLIGGLYGVALGQVFFGESMFHHQPDTSKLALVHLCQQVCPGKYSLIDCQVETNHLASLGAISVSRKVFLANIS